VFKDLYENSDLPSVLKEAKTLSMNECEEIYNYMEKNRPKVILEFGTQFGCSTRVFLEIAKWLEYEVQLHSWDIVNVVKPKCVNQKDFSLHIEDITHKTTKIINRHNPDLVFLDAHPYKLTKNLMDECLNRKITFMAHDIGFEVGKKRAAVRSDNFTNFSNDTKTEWELYLLCNLISEDLWEKDYYEDENMTVKCTRDRYGLAIVEFK